MMLGLNSGTRVALLLMWASCVVTALHLSDEKLSLAVCTDNSECPPAQKCLKGVCTPVSQKPVEFKCTSDIYCPQHLKKCCDGVCKSSCEEPDCCPPIIPRHVRPCVLECYGKDDCPGGELCCFNGCDYECKKPYENCNMTKP
ncbi:uncharacterized protein LOC143018439 isoform X3 [Oratosquilla oratoria]|uniref:uncharacterized protein LOC143018439 isoform X3 n=1 Tax=Oratosquilla oratoria TaxID=337810 RepID=UPI003F766A4A